MVPGHGELSTPRLARLGYRAYNAIFEELGPRVSCVRACVRGCARDGVFCRSFCSRVARRRRIGLRGVLCVDSRRALAKGGMERGEGKL